MRSGASLLAKPRWVVWALLCAALIVAEVGCSARRPRGPGVVHVVKRGENLFRIGKAYGIDYRELARRNRIRDPADIRVGQKIFVPGAKRRLPVEIITPSAVDRAPIGPEEFPVGERLFAWPIRQGRLTSRFGPRSGSFHDGIDIAAPIGTAVYAAGDGVVIYSDRLRGYGNLVIVQHDRDWITVYAHNSVNHVREGAKVRRGDRVANVGQTGRASGPNLHFEVRRGNRARNPLEVLPPL